MNERTSRQRARTANNAPEALQVPAALLTECYPRLARRLRLLWWLGRLRRSARVLRVAGLAFLTASMMLYALYVSAAAYGELSSQLQKLP